ncbi:hypothetical protein JCM8202_003387 [Rhodotorula sphaerocarpa]
MLDRLPPELIALVIDFMNLSAWKRLQTLKALGLVSKSYWAAMRVIRERILFLPSTRAVSAVADVCAWPASRRQRIDTIIFGRGGYIPFAEDHLSFRFDSPEDYDFVAPGFADFIAKTASSTSTAT